MSKVEIRNTEEGALTGTTLRVDGVEIPELSLVSLSHKAGELAQVFAQVATGQPFDVTLHGSVTIIVQPLLPEHEVIVSETADPGTKRYRVVFHRPGCLRQCGCTCGVGLDTRDEK